MDRIVYDSANQHCRKCGKSLRRCGCGRGTDKGSGPPLDGTVRVRREVRRGKPATVVQGVPIDDVALRKLAKELKQKCGSGGGNAKGGEFVLQGDHCELVLEELRARGFTAKRAGG